MGFLDSMKKGFETESNKINELKKYSNYKTIKESTDEYYDRLKRQGDSSLLKKMNDIFTSDDERKVIDIILKERGYKKGKNGRYE